MFEEHCLPAIDDGSYGVLAGSRPQIGNCEKDTQQMQNINELISMYEALFEDPCGNPKLENK